MTRKANFSVSRRHYDADALNAIDTHSFSHVIAAADVDEGGADRVYASSGRFARRATELPSFTIDHIDASNRAAIQSSAHDFGSGGRDHADRGISISHSANDAHRAGEAVLGNGWILTAPAEAGPGKVGASATNTVWLDVDSDLTPTTSVGAAPIHLTPTIPGPTREDADDATISDPSHGQTLIIPDGGTVELFSPFSGTVSFAGATGTLTIDDSSSFTGTISGQLGTGEPDRSQGHNCRQRRHDHLLRQQLARYADSERWGAPSQHCLGRHLLAGQLYSVQRWSRRDIRR